MSSSERTLDIRKDICYCIFLYSKNLIYVYNITATKNFTQFCDSHNAHFSKGIHSLRWQICTRNNVLALSKDATRHVHQKSKKLAQNPTVPRELQDPIRKQRSLHIWHMLFCSNFYSTKITNKLNSRVQLQYLSSYCNHSQISLNYSKYKCACNINRKFKNHSLRQKW